MIDKVLSYEPTEPHQPHSMMGIASFVFALVALVALFISMRMAPPSRASILLIGTLVVSPVLGLALGIGSMVQRTRKRLFGVIGFLVNGLLVLLALLFIVVIGMHRG